MPEARRWGSSVCSRVAASLMTPNGVAGFVEPFRLTMMPALQASFNEWMSPNFQTFQPLEIWLLGIIALGFTTGIRLPLHRLLLLLILCHMALAHVRHAELLGLIGPLAVAASLGPQIAARIRSAAALGDRPGRCAAGSAGPPTGGGAGPRHRRRDQPPGFAAAHRAAERSRNPRCRRSPLQERMRLTGPVFNNEGFGGYLIFSGIPTFIDGRIELYGDAFLARYLEAEHGRRGRPRRIARAIRHYMDAPRARTGRRATPRQPPGMAPRLFGRSRRHPQAIRWIGRCSEQR